MRKELCGRRDVDKPGRRVDGKILLYAKIKHDNQIGDVHVFLVNRNVSTWKYLKRFLYASFILFLFDSGK